MFQNTPNFAAKSLVCHCFHLIRIIKNDVSKYYISSRKQFKFCDNTQHYYAISTAIWFQFKRLPFNAIILTALQTLTLFEVCAPSFFGPSVCPILYCNLTYPTIGTRINYLRISVDILSLPAFILLSFSWCYAFGFFGRATHLAKNGPIYTHILHK